jgi:hypothetical protein
MTRTRNLFPELRHLDERYNKAATPSVTFTATPKQAEFMRAVQSGQYTFMAIGGGIRGTKTICCLATLITLCRIFPRSRWAVVRTDLPTLRRNVVPSMEKLRLWSGGFVGELNHSTWSYTCANGSVIILFSEQFPQDPELERFKGLEVNGFDAEEASELNEKTANKMIERAGSYVIPGTPDDPSPKQPPPIILFNFNPCANWPRKWFYEPWRSGSLRAPYYFLPATIADNPYASDAYKKSLTYLPPEEYKRFVEGEWDFIDDPTQLIKTEWLWAARNVEYVPGEARIGADIARYGDDHTSIYKTEGNRIRKYLNFHKFDLMTVGDAILNEAADERCPVTGPNTRIDVVGLGAGVVDYCIRQGLPVKEVIAGSPETIPRPGSFFTFKNLRSQILWEAREKFRLGQFSLYMEDNKGNEVSLPERLIGDLASFRYRISGDKEIEVEPKDSATIGLATSGNAKWGVKQRLGRSPDDAEALVSALFDFPDTPQRPRFPGTVIIRGYA